MLWDTVEPDRWIDASTLIIHASLAEMSRETEAGFGGDFLFTLKFDEAGTWKIVKTHKMTDKEIKSRNE